MLCFAVQEANGLGRGKLKTLTSWRDQGMSLPSSPISAKKAEQSSENMPERTGWCWTLVLPKKETHVPASTKVARWAPSPCQKLCG